MRNVATGFLAGCAFFAYLTLAAAVLALQVWVIVTVLQWTGVL